MSDADQFKKQLITQQSQGEASSEVLSSNERINAAYKAGASQLELLAEDTNTPQEKTTKSGLSVESREKIKAYLSQSRKPVVPDQGGDTFGRKVARGYIEEDNLIDNLGNYMASEFPNLFGWKLFLGSKKYGTGVKTHEEIYGPGFSKLTPQQKRNFYGQGNDMRMGWWNDETELEAVRNHYADVKPEGFGYGLGQFGAYIVSPEILAPGSLAFKGAMGVAAAGGLYGATAGLVEGLAESGNIEPGKIAAYGAAGAAGGYVIGKAALGLKGLLKSKALDKAGGKMTDETMDTYQVYRDLVDGADATVPKVSKPRAKVDPTTGKPGKPRVRVTPEALDMAQTNRMMEEEKLTNIAFDAAFPEGSNASKILNEKLGVATSAEAKSMIDKGEVPLALEISDEFVSKAGRMSQWGEANNTFWGTMVNKIASGRFFWQPFKILRTMGVEGNKLSRGIDEAMVATNRTIAQGESAYNKVFRRYKKFGVTEQGVNNFLKKIPGPVSKATVKAAAQVKKILDTQVREAVNVGVLTKEEASKMLAKAAKDGYWPRVWDKDHLMSRAGQKDFVETLTGKLFASEAKAMQVIDALTGGQSAEFRAMMKGKKTISPALARSIYHRTGETVFQSKSAHLEHERVLPEEFEELFAKFMWDDPKASLMSYLQDTGNRIEHARVFGAKNQEYDKLHAALSTRYDGSKMKMVEEVYATAARQAGSNALESFLNRPAWIRSIAKKATGLTNYKLAFAPIYNVGQNAINGTTQLQRMRGGINPIKIYVMSLKSILKGGYAMTPVARKSFVDSVDRMGGAVNTTIMSVIGETQAAAAQAGLVKKGGSMLNPANWLDSGNFLRYMQYVSTETFNRRVGTFMGKALIEGNIEKKIALEGKKTLGYFDRKALTKINLVLDELGLDVSKSAAKYTTKELEMGAQRFTNQMNFVNAAQTMPTSWQTMEGRILTKFKSFIINQTGFIGDNVIAPLKRGDIIPAMTYFGVGTPIGMQLDEFRRMVMADDTHYTMVERVARAQMAFGAMGIMQDAIKQTLQPGGLFKFMAGPVVGEGVAAAEAIGKTAVSGYQGEFDYSPLTKRVAGQFVYPGKFKVQQEFREERTTFEKDYYDFRSPTKQYIDAMLGLKK